MLRQIDLQIVKRSDHAKGFEVLPQRWIVERTIGWLNRCRRLAKDWKLITDLPVRSRSDAIEKIE